MELRQLKHFVALAEDMHFGRAAQRLCLSQSALSASIARLEEHFGVLLFERGNRIVRITPSGRLLLQHAKETIHQADRTDRFSQMLAAGRVGRIEVGFTGVLISHELDELMRRLHADLPEIAISLRELTSQRQMELLNAGRLDAGLVFLPMPPQHLQSVTLFDDEFVACLPAEHRLASRADIDIADLRDEPFVLHSRDRAPVMHDQLVSLCTSAGFDPRVVFEAEHLLSLATLVARGFGVGLVPASLVAAELPDLAFVPLRRPLTRRWFFVWHEDREAPGLAAVVERMRGFAAAHGGVVPGLDALRRRRVVTRC